MKLATLVLLTVGVGASVRGDYTYRRHHVQCQRTRNLCLSFATSHNDNDNDLTDMTEARSNALFFSCYNLLRITYITLQNIEAELLWTYNEESKLLREGHHTGLLSREQR